jgi:hypothetical protein
LHDGAYVVFHARSWFTEDAGSRFCGTPPPVRTRRSFSRRRSAGEAYVYHYREFGPQTIEEAFEKLEAAGLPRERHREIDRELKRLKGYEGFTSAIELSFDFDGRTYLFELTAPWYDEYLDLLDDLDDSIEMNEEPPPMGGGYFSQN